MKGRARMLAILALFASLAGLPAQDARDEAVVPARVELLKASAWPELCARDARCSLGRGTASSALAVLDDRSAAPARRAAAVLALGAARESQGRTRVIELTAEKDPELKRAAIWALGLYADARDLPQLLDLAGRKVPQVAEAGAFALGLNGTAAALSALERLAHGDDGPAALGARAALAWRATPPQESELARAYLDVRFEAARAHGLVDGQAWESLLLEDLVRNQRFLNRVVYRSAALLSRRGVADHFLEIALAGVPPERLRGVVRAIPEQLAQLVEAGLFQPSSDEEWRILVDEIARERLEARTEPLLRRAWSVLSVRPHATALLARAGADHSLKLLELQLRSADARERALAAEAIGGARDPSYVSDLSALELDLDPLVRSTALVARLRLGDSSALATLRERAGLAGERALELHPDAGSVLEALSRCGGEPSVRGLAVELLPRLPAGAKVRLASELLLGGYEPSRDVVREYLLSQRPAGESARLAVEALGKQPGAADLALMRTLFPLGDEIDIDVELACALVRSGDAEIVPLLRSTVWSEPWNRSVLAAALWIEAAGMDALRMELQRPPPAISARDLRRVGFALGEWGGLAEVEWLGSRIGPAEPGLQGAVLGALGARTH
ncbi:MAG: HEAT repeat domain-containing protein [Planctomycetes bacterium]|nr:HEAT repeat domain-containing protein [Planctomycetota bacterium]